MNQKKIGRFICEMRKRKKLKDSTNKTKYVELIKKFIFTATLVLSILTVIGISINYLSKTEEERSLDDMRNHLDRKVAVMYFGEFRYPLTYVDGLFRSLNVYGSLNIYDRYPFIKNIPLNEMIDYDGDELYLIVPKDSHSLVTIYLVEFNKKTNTIEKGDILYRTQRKNGHPILMSINSSDEYSNVIVEIEDRKGEKFDFQLKLDPDTSEIDLTGYEEIMSDYSRYYALKKSNNDLLNGFNEDEIYGKWEAKYTFEDDNTYYMGLIINEDGTVSIECKENNNLLFTYEGTYKFSTDDLKYGQILINLNLKLNDSNLELSNKMESVFQLVPFAFREGFKMQFVSGQTNCDLLQHPIYEFEPKYR